MRTSLHRILSPLLFLSAALITAASSASAQQNNCTEYPGGITICNGPVGQQSQQIKYPGGSGGYYSDSQGNSGSTTTYNGRTTLDNTNKDVTPPQRSSPYPYQK